MPESAEEIHARVQAATGADGRLPMSRVQEWDIFPWEIVDGALLPKVLPAPTGEPEPLRAGAGGVDCGLCSTEPPNAIWQDEHWLLTHPGRAGGLPLVLFLASKEHLDYPDLDDSLAAEYGRLSVRLCRIVSGLRNIGRVHVCRWGDGAEHLHVWFIARTARLPNVLGSMAVEWDEMLPPVPEEIWRADLRSVARALAEVGGEALI